MQQDDNESAPLSIENISSPSPNLVPDIADAETALGVSTLQNQATAIKVDHLRTSLKSFKQDVDQRKAYAPKLYSLTCCWLVSVIMILLLQGFGLHFKLSDSVLLALLGTTTANIIGLFYVVAKHLFPASDARDDEPSVKAEG